MIRTWKACLRKLTSCLGNGCDIRSCILENARTNEVIALRIYPRWRLGGHQTTHTNKPELKNSMKKGKLIVLYGINSLGKTTQAKLLVEKIKSSGKKAEHIKIPVYNLDPSGLMIDEYLRKGNPENLDLREIALIYAYNRMQFAPKLEEFLQSGSNIVLEDYWGTGVAWSMGAGVGKEFMLRINKPFMNEDFAILLDGKQFPGGKEEGHRHEEDKLLTEKVRRIHQELARELGWKKIDANQSIEKVREQIWIGVKDAIE